ncbi:MAG: hypothetical protein AAF213_00200 [Pseudomonadota bacterium]
MLWPLGLMACANDTTVGQVLPYWDAPTASSPSVLQAAQAFDPSGKPFPSLATVPQRPSISAAQRIASLEGELTQDQTIAAALRDGGARPDSPTIDEIDGLDEFQVDPAPDAPVLGSVPRVDLTAGNARGNTVRLPLNQPGLGDATVIDRSLPARVGGTPVPPPRRNDSPPPPPMAAPPAPALTALPVPDPVDETPPAFVVAPIETPASVAEPAVVATPPSAPNVEAPPAFDPPPVFDAPPAFDAPPVLDAPPVFDPAPLEVAAVPDLQPLPAPGMPDTSLTSSSLANGNPAPQAAAWIDLTPEGTVAESSRVLLDDIIAEALAGDGRSRFRLVGYADDDVMTADVALGRARVVADYMQAQNIARGRLVLAPPTLLSNDPRIGSVAVFVLP